MWPDSNALSAMVTSCLPFSKHLIFCSDWSPKVLFINYFILHHITTLGHFFLSLFSHIILYV